MITIIITTTTTIMLLLYNASIVYHYHTPFKANSKRCGLKDTQRVKHVLSRLGREGCSVLTGKPQVKSGTGQATGKIRHRQTTGKIRHGQTTGKIRHGTSHR